ncbi:MAG: TerB family tellurite resistance protein [Candidatus Thalassarchaeaceae archaeon]|nr:TerB family tellurite resistance protein [Candidatus Thalassarchaeaceae archaeon]
MKPSHPDAFLSVNRDDYMTVLAIIANADNVLKEEEMSFFESRMARMLINPKLRSQFRDLLRNEYDVEETIKKMDEKTLRLALRDGIFLAAADGEVHPSEVETIRIVAKYAGVDSDRLKEIWTWVQDGLEWMSTGPSLLEVSLRDKDDD